jgi:RNA polymerase sigma-70 factor (ECF subfamily)
MGPDLQGKVDPSDLAQQTLLKAHQNREQFRGQTDAQLGAWLRRILANELVDALRRTHGVADQAVLERSLNDSTARLEALLADESLSPSTQAAQEEELLRLSQALARLEPDQRFAVEQKYLYSRSVESIGKLMGRSKQAVGGLLRRGLKSLRVAMNE